MADGGRLGKLKSKLAELSDNIDKADERKAEAKANILEAEARLEKAEAEVASKNRSIKLLRSDLSSALERCSEMENRVGAVEAGSVEVEERRKELEENENT